MDARSDHKLTQHYLELSNYLKGCKAAFETRWASKMSSKGSMNDFNKLQTLGAGSFGRVLLVIHKETKKPFAMKVMDKANIVKMKQVKHTLSEIRVLDAIRFDFVVYMEYYFKDNVYLFLFLPFINGGEMFTHLRRLTKFEENMSKFYASQVILAFEYLHYLGLVYRDLKPENLLIDRDGYVKVTDLGFAKKIDNSRTYTLCGTPEYLAPEIILSKGYNFSVDWWSLGILIFEMASGNPPFFANDPMKTYEKIVKGKYVCPPHFSPELKDLIANVIQVDLTKRFGGLRNGVKDIKAHAWFKPLDWNAVLARKVKPSFVPKTSNPEDAGNFDQYEEEPWLTSDVDLFPEEFADIQIKA